MSLQVVIPEKPIENKFWSGKAVTKSELKTLTTETVYEGRTYFNRTATTLLERAKRLGALIISPRYDIPLEQQLDTALGRKNKSEGWIKGSLTYLSVFLLFSLILQAIAKSN